MRLLDLFCGAGGAAAGYHNVGFEVVGVDIAPQPAFPFEFHRADALTFPLDGFDMIHASPPCQFYAAGPRAMNLSQGRIYDHPALIDPIRERLLESGIPYVIENVIGAPLRAPVQLCGTAFRLPLRRHRLFESSLLLFGTECRHELFSEPRYWTSWRPGGEERRATTVQVYGAGAEKHEWPRAMGINWMTYDQLAQAIPPAYTEYLGKQIFLTLSY